MKKQEFILVFSKGQEYLITRRKLSVTFYPCYDKSYLKSREVTPRQLARLMDDPKNQDFSFEYNGETMDNWVVDFAWSEYLAKVSIYNAFPGYEKDPLNGGMA